MRANPSLSGTLPRLYNRDNIDQRRLGELVDLFNSARFTRQGEHRARDLMGEVYEYFLGAFARAEGKRGGEFFTPPSVVKVIVEVLQPSGGRVYDPCCGSGGMFVQTDKFIRAHDGDPTNVHIYDQTNEEPLAAGQDEPRHSRHRQQRPGRSLGRHVRPRHSPRRADGLRDGEPAVQHQRLGSQRRRPSLALRRAAGHQRSTTRGFQHILSKLKPQGPGRCGGGRRLDVVELQWRGHHSRRCRGRPSVTHGGACPPRCSAPPAILVCLRFFAKNKGDRAGDVLFIDARGMGHMVDRSQTSASWTRTSGGSSGTYHAWLGTSTVRPGEIETYADVPGFSKRDPGRDQSSRLRPDARTLRRGRRGRGRRGGHRRQDRTAYQGVAGSIRRVRAVGEGRA